MSASPLLEAALTAWRAGLNVWPPTQDGSKRPDRPSWTEFQHRQVTEAELRKVYGDSYRTGLGVFCGPISAGLALFEFDDHASALPAFETLIADNGLGPLWQRTKAAYWEHSPGGGLRTLIRTSDPGRSQKLAVRAKQPHEMRNEHDRWQVTVETRGTGGYAVVAPTYGTVHPTGRPYERLAGGIETIATLSGDEWENLCAVARILDEKPRPIYNAPSPRSSRDASDKPGDRYNAETSWESLLPSYGWRIDHRHGPTTYWTRPGKDHGVSATTNYQGNDLLWVFSSSTGLDPDRSYDRFVFYTVMTHAGDFRAAAQALAAKRSLDAPPRPMSTLPPVRGRRSLIALTAEETTYAR
jgi:putative DNA primase/helicase